MANSDFAFGFELVDDNGVMPAQQTYTVDSSNATTFAIGDPISIEADGNVTRSAAGDGVIVDAIVQGIRGDDGKQKITLPTSTAGTIKGIPVKGRKFRVQADSGTTVNATDVNATADFVAGAFSTVNSRSGYELDSSDIGTGLQLRIIGIDPDSEFGAETPNLIVTFNEFVGNAGTASV